MTRSLILESSFIAQVDMLNKSRVSADYSKPTSVEYWYSNLFKQDTWIHFRRVGLWSLNETLSTNQLTKLVSNIPI